MFTVFTYSGLPLRAEQATNGFCQAPIFISNSIVYWRENGPQKQNCIAQFHFFCLAGFTAPVLLQLVQYCRRSTILQA